MCFSREYGCEWIVFNEASPFISLIPSQRPLWNPCSKCIWSMYYQSQALRAHHTTGVLTERLLVGKRIVTLFRKLGDQKDGGLLSQRIIFAEVELGFLLHEKISIASLQIWTYCSCWVPELKSSENTYSEKGKGFATTTESGKYGSTMFLSGDFWVRSLPHTLHCCVFSPG